MKNILLIGLGRFGRHMAEQLNQMGHEIMAVDLNEERVEKVLPFVTNAQIGDCTDADYLRSLGIRNYAIQKSRWQNGHLSDMLTIISWIIWR